MCKYQHTPNQIDGSVPKYHVGCSTVILGILGTCFTLGTLYPLPSI